jgi:DNA-binding transcriptional LysR family regulator
VIRRSGERAAITDRFDAMHAFVAVSDGGGFSAAARRLSLSPSAVTRLVAALERSLGVQLLHRSTRSVRLTRAGEAYLPLARQTLEQVAAAERAAKAEDAALSGTLRLAAPLLFGRLHAGHLLARFMAAQPDVRVELSLSNDFARLIEEGVDVAIRIGQLPDSGLLTRSLGHTRPVLAASPAYLAERGTPRHPAELAGHRLIGFEGVSPRRAWRFTENGSPVTTTVDPVFYSDNGEPAIALAVAGGGIVSALHYQVAHYLRAGELVEVLAEFAPPPLPIQAVLPGARFVSPAVRAVLDLFVQERASWQG